MSVVFLAVFFLTIQGYFAARQIPMKFAGQIEHCICWILYLCGIFIDRKCHIVVLKKIWITPTG